jgi:hypothetical protein
MQFGTYPNIIGASVPKFRVVEGGNDRAMERNILRSVWNTNYSCNNNRAIGGFRAVMNAGDYLSRVNSACGGPNQVTSRPGMMVMSTKDGVVGGPCDPNKPPIASTNVKYVYDSSDYTRYMKEKSVNEGYAGNAPCKNNKYNMTDYSYGGSGFPVGRGRQRSSIRNAF